MAHSTGVQGYDDFEIHRCEDDLFMNLFADPHTIKQACRQSFYFLNERELDEKTKAIQKELKRFKTPASKNYRTEWLAYRSMLEEK